MISVAIAALVVLAGLIAVVVLGRRGRLELAWVSVRFGRELDVSGVEAFLRAVAADRRRDPVVFEATGSQRRVGFRVGTSSSYLAQVSELLQQFCPSVVIEDEARRVAATGWAWRVVVSSRHRPLRLDPEVITRGLLSALASVDGEAEVTMQWVLGRRIPAVAVSSRLAGLPSTSWLEALIQTLRQPREDTDAELRRALRTKVGEAGFRVIGRIAVTGAGKTTARVHGRRLVAALRIAEGPAAGFRATRGRYAQFADGTTPSSRAAGLNVQELVGLLGWPLGDGAYRGVERIARTPLPVPSAVPGSGRVFGVSSYPGTDRQLALSAGDALEHCHVIGPTGVGKSTLLLNLITADIADGRGVVVIDPKGDLVADVLARIPVNRRDDVVLLDPADGERPVGINPLATNGRAPELVADQILAVFHGLYRDNWGPRTQDILHASLLTLAGQPDVTLCSLPVLLANAQYRRRLVARVDDQIALGPFWAWFEAISDAERQQAIAPVMNKLRAFLLRPRMRAVIGQATPRFDVASVFTERRILLASLGKGVIGPEASALLGALVVSQVWNAAQSRSAISPDQRHPVMGYIDEFQDYLHLPTDLADVLAQARGLGLGLTLAHQHLDQLTPVVREAVLANARSRICFQLAAKDAGHFARHSDRLEARDFMALDKYEVYAALVADGRVTPYASARTLPPAEPVSDREAIKTASRERYGTPFGDVEAQLADLVGRRNPDETVGRRPRNQP